MYGDNERIIPEECFFPMDERIGVGAEKNNEESRKPIVNASSGVTVKENDPSNVKGAEAQVDRDNWRPTIIQRNSFNEPVVESKGFIKSEAFLKKKGFFANKKITPEECFFPMDACMDVGAEKNNEESRDEGADNKTINVCNGSVTTLTSLLTKEIAGALRPTI